MPSWVRDLQAHQMHAARCVQCRQGETSSHTLKSHTPQLLLLWLRPWPPNSITGSPPPPLLRGERRPSLVDGDGLLSGGLGALVVCQVLTTFACRSRQEARFRLTRCLLSTACHNPPGVHHKTQATFTLCTLWCRVAATCQVHQTQRARCLQASAIPLWLADRHLQGKHCVAGSSGGGGRGCDAADGVGVLYPMWAGTGTRREGLRTEQAQTDAETSSGKGLAAVRPSPGPRCSRPRTRVAAAALVVVARAARHPACGGLAHESQHLWRCSSRWQQDACGMAPTRAPPSRLRSAARTLVHHHPACTPHGLALSISAGSACHARHAHLRERPPSKSRTPPDRTSCASL